MNSLYKFFDHPVGRFLIVGVFSISAAYLFWWVGGNFAKVVWEGNKTLGASFELGGAIAGFVSVFLTSNWILRKLYLQSYTRLVTAFLTPREWFAKDAGYSCQLSIYDRESGNERTLNVAPRRANGHLTVDVRDLSTRESFIIELTNTNGDKWRSESTHPAAPQTQMQPYESKAAQ